MTNEEYAEIMDKSNFMIDSANPYDMKIKEALEKQIPKKPRFYSGNYYCPACGDLVGFHDIFMKWDNKFCKACGQRIDWNEGKQEE